MQEVASQAERLSAFFQNAVERDEKAFLDLLASRKLPKDTSEQQAVRAKAIETATVNAGCVPLEVAQQAYKVIEMAAEVAEKGNANAITDACSAALLARTALAGAGLNVRINAGGLENRSMADKWETDLIEFEKKGNVLMEQVRLVLKDRADIPLGMSNFDSGSE
jgi:formiminotetrahydrofolate cyclodeaminase